MMNEEIKRWTKSHYFTNLFFPLQSLLAFQAELKIKLLNKTLDNFFL